MYFKNCFGDRQKQRVSESVVKEMGISRVGTNPYNRNVLALFDEGGFVFGWLVGLTDNQYKNAERFLPVGCGIQETRW